MNVQSDKDNNWTFSAWVINLKPWKFISVVWSVNRHEMGLGLRWNTNGFLEVCLLPIALRVSFVDSREDELSAWYGWVEGDPYPEV